MKEAKRGSWLKHLDFMILDILLIECAYLLSYEICQPQMFLAGRISLYIYADIVLIVTDVCYVILRPVYKNIIKRNIFHEVRSVLLHSIVLWLVMISSLYMTQLAFLFSRSMMGVFILLCFSFMLIGRVAWKAFLRTQIVKGKRQANMLLISEREHAAYIIRRFRQRVYNGFNLSGLAVMDEDIVGQKIEGIPVICGRDNLLDYVKEQVIDEVILDLPGGGRENQSLVYGLLNMGVVVHMTMDYDADAFPNIEIERLGGFTVLTTSINTISRSHLAIKRMIDIVAGLVGTAITGVLFLILAPMIYRASPGPIFYAQERIGKNGRCFRMYKFRSMYLDADAQKAALLNQNEMQGPMFKIDNDPRIIGSEKGPGKGIGNWIRKTSIDEFPQFINILKGDMSLVGTRPPTVEEFEQYDYHHKVRLSMKPGLTGLWQVNGRNEITDFEQIVRMDASYIEHWSLLLDFKLILKTIPVVLGKKGA
ncbi:MAG: sugar transferase [Clostridiales bacterium]|nr:sugar transferase [Clostridiales bacterium]